MVNVRDYRMWGIYTDIMKQRGIRGSYEHWIKRLDSDLKNRHIDHQMWMARGYDMIEKCKTVYNQVRLWSMGE
jgi:hypothetical protein